MMKTMCWIRSIPRIAVPVILEVCGLPLALSVTLTVPVMVPTAVGAKLTVIVQLLPAARLEPQVLVTVYFLLMVMLVIVSAAVPVLVRVTFCPALIVLMICCPKVRLAGDKLTAGLPAANSGDEITRHANKQTTPTPFRNSSDLDCE